MNERLELQLRIGLASLLDPAVGSHPRWASSPAAERIAAPADRGRRRWRPMLLVAAVIALLLIGGSFALLSAGLIPPVSPPVVPGPTATPAATPTPAPTALPSPLGGLVTRPVVANVTEVAFAPDGTAWLATPRGVAHWDLAAGTVRLYGQGDGLPATSASRVTVGPDGSVWATGTGWAATFDGTRWTAFTDFGIATAPDLGGIAVGPDETFWVAASATNGAGRLLRYDGAWSAVDGPPDLPGTTFPWTQRLAVTPDGTVWATAGNPSGGPPGVYAYDGHAWRVAATSATLGGRPVLAGVESGGAVWVSMEAICMVETSPCVVAGNGVARFDGSRWTGYTTADGLVTNDVRLAVGADGSAWATYGESRAGPGKVSRFEGTRWITFDVPEAAGSTAMAVAPDGALWLTSAEGLSRFDGKTFSHLTIPDAQVAAGLPPLALTASGGPVSATGATGTVSWQAYAPPGGHFLLPVVGTTHGFVANDGPDLRWSTDGITWEGTGLSIGPWRLSVDGDDVIASGEGGAVRLAWDGARWVETERLQVAGAPGLFVEQVAYGPHGAVMTGGEKVAYSADGHRFVLATQPPTRTEQRPTPKSTLCDPIGGASGPGEGRIGPVLATPDGFVALTARLPAGWNSTPWCEPVPWFSADGNRWELRSPESPFGAGAWVSDIAAADGRYVAVGGVGETGAVWVSDDALTWQLLPVRIGRVWTVGVGGLGWIVVSLEATGQGMFWQAWLSTDTLAWERLPDMGISGGYITPEVAVGSSRFVASDGSNVTIATLAR